MATALSSNTSAMLITQPAHRAGDQQRRRLRHQEGHRESAGTARQAVLHHRQLPQRPARHPGDLRGSWATPSASLSPPSYPTADASPASNSTIPDNSPSCALLTLRPPTLSHVIMLAARLLLADMVSFHQIRLVPLFVIFWPPSVELFSMMFFYDHQNCEVHCPIPVLSSKAHSNTEWSCTHN